MEIEIIAVGGYDEVGRNMTAVRCGKEIVIFDMGLRLDQLMIHEDAEVDEMHSLDLIKIKAIPDDTVLQTVEGTVKAIVCSHGHLDHIGAIPKLAHRYKAPIIATPYATELIRQQISGEKKFSVGNRLFALSAGQRYTLSQNLVLEFVHTQHSIIDTVTPVLHTPHGAIVYACDFKFDRTPVIGKPPDFARFRQLGKEGVLALIVESTYIHRPGRCPSERIARDLVRDVITSFEDDKSAILVSTFSSHISRVKTIAECAHEIGRKPVFLGRSMEKYSVTAEQMKFVSFPPDDQRLREPEDRGPRDAEDDEGGKGEVPADRHRSPGRARVDPHPSGAGRYPVPAEQGRQGALLGKRDPEPDEFRAAVCRRAAARRRPAPGSSRTCT